MNSRALHCRSDEDFGRGTDQSPIRPAAAPHRPSGGFGENATISVVSVLKRLGPRHFHVRTPIMLAIIVLLVLLGSAVCYYRVGTLAPGL